MRHRPPRRRRIRFRQSETNDDIALRQQLRALPGHGIGDGCLNNWITRCWRNTEGEEGVCRDFEGSENARGVERLGMRCLDTSGKHFPSATRTLGRLSRWWQRLESWRCVPHRLVPSFPLLARCTSLRIELKIYYSSQPSHDVSSLRLRPLSAFDEINSLPFPQCLLHFTRDSPVS